LFCLFFCLFLTPIDHPPEPSPLRFDAGRPLCFPAASISVFFFSSVAPPRRIAASPAIVFTVISVRTLLFCQLFAAAGAAGKMRTASRDGATMMYDCRLCFAPQYLEDVYELYCRHASQMPRLV